MGCAGVAGNYQQFARIRGKVESLSYAQVWSPTTFTASRIAAITFALSLVTASTTKGSAPRGETQNLPADET